MKKAVLVVVVFVIIFFGMKLGVKSNDYNNNRLKQEDKYEYYQELEERFTTVIRNTLEADGFSNAGITVTSIINLGGFREYKVEIHHSRFDQMNEDAVKGYENKLAKIDFPDSDCKTSLSIVRL